MVRKWIFLEKINFEISKVKREKWPHHKFMNHKFMIHNPIVRSRKNLSSLFVRDMYDNYSIRGYSIIEQKYF